MEVLSFTIDVGKANCRLACAMRGVLSNGALATGIPCLRQSNHLPPACSSREWLRPTEPESASWEQEPASPPAGRISHRSLPLSSLEVHAAFRRSKCPCFGCRAPEPSLPYQLFVPSGHPQCPFLSSGRLQLEGPLWSVTRYMCRNASKPCAPWVLLDQLQRLDLLLTHLDWRRAGGINPNAGGALP